MSNSFITSILNKSHYSKNRSISFLIIIIILINKIPYKLYIFINNLSSFYFNRG